MAQQSSDMPVEDRTVIGFPISEAGMLRLRARKIDWAVRITVGAIGAVFLFSGLYRIRKGI
jgi:hypothetical protein